MHKLMVLVLMGICGVTLTLAGEPAPAGDFLRVPQPAGRKLWRASLGAVVAVNGMDAGSSWGKHELNPNLAGNDGRFGWQGAVLKMGIVGGVLIVESLVLRHRPSPKLYRGLALVNLGGASVTGATAIRNFGIPRQ